MSFSAQQSYSGTLVASTAQTVTFGYSSNNTPIRYAYVAICNTGTTVIYARTDGTAATVGGDFCTAVEPGATVVMANELPLWTQAATVIPAGYDQPSALAAGQPGWPGTPASPNTGAAGGWAGSGTPYGQSVNPGTSVSLISSSTPTFTVSGTG